MINAFSCVSGCDQVVAPRTVVILGPSYHPSVNADLIDDEVGAPDNVISIDCFGLMEQDAFMRDKMVNHKGVSYDAKTQLQAVSERV